MGSTGISKAEFAELMAEAKAQFKSQGVTFPAANSATYKAYKAQIVAYLVQAQVVAQSAKSLGVSVTDAEVATQVAQYEKTYGGKAKLLSLLKSSGMTMALLKKSIKIQRLSQLAASKVTASATVSAAQIQAYWQAHKAKLRKTKKTATFAKAKATIRKTLLSQAKSKLWTAWLAGAEQQARSEVRGRLRPRRPDRLTRAQRLGFRRRGWLKGGCAAPAARAVEAAPGPTAR